MVVVICVVYVGLNYIINEWSEHYQIGGIHDLDQEINRATSKGVEWVEEQGGETRCLHYVKSLMR